MEPTLTELVPYCPYETHRLSEHVSSIRCCLHHLLATYTTQFVINYRFRIKKIKKKTNKVIKIKNILMRNISKGVKGFCGFFNEEFFGVNFLLMFMND